MGYTMRKIIKSLEEFEKISVKLESLPLEFWIQKSFEHQWTLKEVLLHLYLLDFHLLAETFPFLRGSKKVTFPKNYDNQTEMKKFIDDNKEFDIMILLRNSRKELIKQIKSMNSEILEHPILINGNLISLSTGKQMNGHLLLEEYAYHNQHHFREIVFFLNKK